MSDNIEYDRIHFEIVNGDPIAQDNVVVEEILSEEDTISLASDGFIIRRIDDYNFWVVSARVDVEGMTAGVEELHRQIRLR